MNVSTYTRCQTTLRLEQEEEFVAHNDKGYPFYVREMHYGGGHGVTLSGPALVRDKEDGETRRGYISRSVLVPLTDLKPETSD
jgi:hypothetical protein